MDTTLEAKKKKVVLLYIFIIFLFFLFLAAMFQNAITARHLPAKYITNSYNAQRGSIISADGYNLALSTKLYKAVVNTRYIDPQKKELFITLFSIYSGIHKDKIRKKINSKNGLVTLSFNINEKRAQYLKKLSRELRRFQVFIGLRNKRTGFIQVHGLNILASGERRTYPYGNLLTPIIGYPHKIEENGYTSIVGIKGLEKKFNDDLTAREKGIKRGSRDVNSYIILNKKSYSKASKDGLDLKLTIPVSLQIKMEQMLDKMKIKTKSKQIMLAIMDINSSNILTLASSNRFFPKNIKRSDYSSLRSGMTEYSFEAGSVIKPLTLSLILENKHISSVHELVNCENGRYKIGKKVITDEHRMRYTSAENIIVYSSNIGIAKLAQKLRGNEFHKGLLKFGFSQPSTPDLVYERVGSIPSPLRLENEIYKATCSYGYGMKTNLMQLIRAYSVFNNEGKILTPRIVDYLIDNKQKIPLETFEAKRVLNKRIANILKTTLIKTVNKGTGKKAIVKGLIIGGKTGTAHIVEKGKYVNRYNTSFIGFANDKKSKFIIGVVVVEPKSSQFASKTAVPVFRKAVEIMIEDGYLKPNIVK